MSEPRNETASPLDRAWDLLSQGNVEEAAVLARASLEKTPDHPEAHTMLGLVASAEGDPREALECFRRAVKVANDYLPALVHAAEILLEEDEPESCEEALEFLDSALDVAEEEDEYLDALLLRAQALTQLDLEEEAKATLAEIPPVDLPDPGFHARAGWCYLHLDSFSEAEQHFNAAVAKAPDDSDSKHGLGMVYEAKGDLEGQVKAWLGVRELDLADEPAPWAVSRETFEKIAEAALAELPERARKLLENVPILAADYPSVDVIKDGFDPRMMGFFSGVPYPEKVSVGGTSPHLDCVFLFQRNIERFSRTSEEVADEIRTTLIHETGHFFGLSDDDLEEMGLG